MTKVRNVALAFSALSFLGAVATACDDESVTGGSGFSLSLEDGGGFTLPDGAPAPGVNGETAANQDGDASDGTDGGPKAHVTGPADSGAVIRDAGYDAARDALAPIHDDQQHVLNVAPAAVAPASAGAHDVLLALFAITA